MLITKEEFSLLEDLVFNWYGSWEIKFFYANKEETFILNSLNKLYEYGLIAVQEGIYSEDHWTNFKITKEVPILQLFDRNIHPEYVNFWEPPANGIIFVLNCTLVWEKLYYSRQEIAIM